MILDGVEINVDALLQKWFGDVQIVGDERLVSCPWDTHSKTGQKRVYINNETGLWQCKVCKDKSGNIVTLTMLMEQLDYVSANDYLKDHGSEVDFEAFGQQIIDILHEDDPDETARPIRLLRQDTRRVIRKASTTDKRGLDYWHGRGLEDSTISDWRLAYLPFAKFPYIFPVYIGGKLTCYIARTRSASGRRYDYQRGFPRASILYGLEEASPEATIVLCEGPLDCLSIWQALKHRGLLDTFAPAAILGSEITRRQADAIERAGNRVIAFFDNDHGGRIALLSARRMIRNVELLAVRWPRMMEGEDPNKLEADEIVQLIRGAGTLTRKMLEEPDFADEIQEQDKKLKSRSRDARQVQDRSGRR